MLKGGTFAVIPIGEVISGVNFMQRISEIRLPDTR